jgi:hypothetical protein
MPSSLYMYPSAEKVALKKGALALALTLYTISAQGRQEYSTIDQARGWTYQAAPTGERQLGRHGKASQRECAAVSSQAGLGGAWSCDRSWGAWRRSRNSQER